MRDGVELSTDVYQPPEGGPFPALLLRTIYNNQDAHFIEWARRFLEHGYAVVMQDCRGRHDSDGVWEPYVREADDGYDTQEWIGRQDWCDGNVGTFGSSYLGFTQTQTAPLASRYLKGLVPIASQEDNWSHLYLDGALRLYAAKSFVKFIKRTTQDGAWSLLDKDAFMRELPLLTALDKYADSPFYRDMIRHSSFDDFWSSYSLRERYGDIQVPAYFITGWYDALARSTLRMYEGWKSGAATDDARRHTRLTIGPWYHMIGPADRIGDVDFGPDAGVDIPAEHVAWYDQRLKDIDTGIDGRPPVRIFVMGDNTWRDENEWPLARTRYTDYYLHSGGAANTLNGDGTLTTEPARVAPRDAPHDTYDYDPDDPVPTHGGQIMHRPTAGPRDRREVEKRHDVLVYTSDPLDQDLEVTGPVTANIYAASSATDTDFTVTLIDVHPDGMAIDICEGIRRARTLKSDTEPSPIEPGEVYEYDVDVWQTSNVFKRGHRIRVEVSSSNFPRFDRNPNTGHTPGLDAEIATAHQTILHNTTHPSRVTLPVIPR